MTVELRNSPNLSKPRGFSHVSIAPAGRIVHIAGQVGTDSNGVLQGGLAEQTERALLNLAEALDAAGATAADLVKLTYLVVGWREAMIPEFVAGITKAAATRPFPPVPSTLHGVQSLFLDGMLVEVEGVAVLPPE